VDFILQRLISDVSAWYDLHYQARPKMLERSKQLHVAVLIKLYDPKRFSAGSDLKAERIALLIDTQQAVNIIRRNGYNL